MNEHHTCKHSSYCPECEVERLSCEGSRYREALEDIALSVADEAYCQIDVSGQWMLDRARRALTPKGPELK